MKHEIHYKGKYAKRKKSYFETRFIMEVNVLGENDWIVNNCVKYMKFSAKFNFRFGFRKKLAIRK